MPMFPAQPPQVPQIPMQLGLLPNPNDPRTYPAGMMRLGGPTQRQPAGRGGDGRNAAAPPAYTPKDVLESQQRLGDHFQRQPPAAYNWPGYIGTAGNAWLGTYLPTRAEERSRENERISADASRRAVSATSLDQALNALVGGSPEQRNQATQAQMATLVDQAKRARMMQDLQRAFAQSGGSEQPPTAPATPPASVPDPFAAPATVVPGVQGPMMDGGEYTGPSVMPAPASAPAPASPPATTGPPAAPAIPPMSFNPMADPTVRASVLGSLAVGDTAGAMTALEQAGRQYREVQLAGPKRVAEKRADNQVSDERSQQAAQTMWGFTDQLERAANAIGNARLDSAASPTLDTWWGSNFGRHLGGQQQWNDRQKLNAYIDNIIVQARETQRGLGTLTEGEQETLARAYAGMRNATDAQSFRDQIGVIRHVLSSKIPGRQGYVPDWITRAETERRRQGRGAPPPEGLLPGEQPLPQLPTAPGPAATAAPPAGPGQQPSPPGSIATQTDQLGPELEGRTVYDNQAKQWGRVVGGQFVPMGRLMQRGLRNNAPWERRSTPNYGQP